MEKCDQIADVDPYVVSKNLAIYANSVRSYGRHKALNVYISAPPSELELILKLSFSILKIFRGRYLSFWTLPPQRHLAD